MELQAHPSEHVCLEIFDFQPELVVGGRAEHLPVTLHRAGRGCFFDHQLDQAALAHAFDRPGADGDPVAQHRVVVRHAEDLFHAVRDEDDGLAGPFPLRDQLEQALDLPVVQAGGRLVQDDQARVKTDRFEDFDDLFLVGWQSRYGRVRLQRRSEGALKQGQQGCRPFA